MRYFIDTSAWIEYFEGSQIAEKVRNVIKDKNNEIITLPINISEVVSKFKRLDKDFEEVYNAIISISKVWDISSEMAKQAGIIHAEEKKKIDSFGLVDALLIASAKSYSAQIITKDGHFKNFKEAILI